jgi:hypothetical protein
MSKLIVPLVVAGLSLGLNVAVAQDSTTNKDGARAARGTQQDCATLSGKEQDECIQATPAGPVDMETGKQNKAKSEMAVDRDREKAESTGADDIPKQSQDTVGHPSANRSPGEGETTQQPGEKKSGSEPR